jgi:hypothetical protein
MIKKIKKHLTQPLIAIFCSVFVFLPSSGFAEVKVQDLLDAQLKTGFDCFNPNSIRSWKAIDRFNLLISTSKKNRTYLLRFEKPCLFLDMTNALKMVSDRVQVCDRDFVRIIDIGSSEYCDVRQTRQLDADKVKALYEKDTEDKQADDKAKDKSKEKSK